MPHYVASDMGLHCFSGKNGLKTDIILFSQRGTNLQLPVSAMINGALPKMASTSKGENLLLGEQILSFKI